MKTFERGTVPSKVGSNGDHINVRFTLHKNHHQYSNSLNMKTSQIAQFFFMGAASAAVLQVRQDYGHIQQCLLDECSESNEELLSRCNPPTDLEGADDDITNVSDGDRLQYLACYCEVLQSANNGCRSCLNQASSEEDVTLGSICQQISSSSSSGTSMSSTSTAGSPTTTTAPVESEDGNNNDDDNNDDNNNDSDEDSDNSENEDDDGDSGANAFSFKYSAMVASGLAVGAAVLL